MKNIDERLLKIENQLELLSIKTDIIYHKLVRDEELIKLSPIQDDDLFNRAKEVVIEAGKASASLLQRRLEIGYARAARLLDILEKEGVIGPSEGAMPRDVLIKE